MVGRGGASTCEVLGVALVGGTWKVLVLVKFWGSV